MRRKYCGDYKPLPDGNCYENVHIATTNNVETFLHDFFSNSEGNASELLGNHEKMHPTCIDISPSSNLPSCNNKNIMITNIYIGLFF